MSQLLVFEHEEKEDEEEEEEEEEEEGKETKNKRPLHEIQSEEALWTYVGLKPYARTSFPQNFPKNKEKEKEGKKDNRKISENILQDFVCAIADDLNEYRWHDIDEMLFHLCLMYSVWPDYLDHKEYPKCCWINNMPPYWNKWIERGDVVLFKVCSEVHRIKI